MSTLVCISVVSFALGVLVGNTTKDALDLWHTSRKERRAMRRTKVITPARLRVAAVWVVVLTQFVVGVLLIVTYTTAARYTKCSATWQQEFGDSYRARAQAATAASDALDAVVRAVAANDPELFRKALANYVAVRDAQNRQRELNPLPEPPAVLCGEPEGS